MSFGSSDIDILKQLAGLNEKDDLSQYEHQLPTGDIGDIVARILENDAQAKIAVAANVIAEVLRVKAAKVTEVVEKIRELRRQERDLLAALKLYNQAEEYGANTSNYVPLAKVLNDSFPSPSMASMYGLPEVTEAPKKTRKTP